MFWIVIIMLLFIAIIPGVARNFLGIILLYLFLKFLNWILHAISIKEIVYITIAFIGVVAFGLVYLMGFISLVRFFLN